MIDRHEAEKMSAELTKRFRPVDKVSSDSVIISAKDSEITSLRSKNDIEASKDDEDDENISFRAVTQSFPASIRDNINDIKKINVWSEFVAAVRYTCSQCNWSSFTKLVWIACGIIFVFMVYDSAVIRATTSEQRGTTDPFTNYASFASMVTPSNAQEQEDENVVGPQSNDVIPDNPDTMAEPSANMIPLDSEGRMILLNPDGPNANVPNIPKFVNRNLADVDEPMGQNDVLIFWHVARSAGTTMKTVGAVCLGLTMVTEVGAVGHENDKKLEVNQFSKPKGKFVNVDASTAAGLEKAKELELGSSGLAQMIVANHFLKVVDIFDAEHRGRMFCLLRHPVDRVASLYNTLIKHDDTVANMTLEEFAVDRRGGANQMVRILAGSEGQSPTNEELGIAKEILRKKFLIGLLDRKRDSFYRFERFFGWKYSNIDKRVCTERFLDWDWAGRNAYQPVYRESDTGKMIVAANIFDVQLYLYAEKLFKEQWKLFY